MFDHDCDVLLCAQDGTIIYSKGDDRGVANFIEGLSEFPFEDKADEKRVIEAFSNRDDALYSYRESELSTVGCIAYVGDTSDFFLVLNFPADAYQEMLKNANGNGVSLLLSLIGIFAVAAVFFVVRFLMQKRRLVEEAKNSNDIHFAMSRLFENFVLVNARTRTYHYIEGMPDVGHIPNDGPYDLFASDLLKRSTNENEREEAAQLISFEHLTELMNQGNDVVSFNLHVPIGEEEWLTYNFIVISREADGLVSEFIVARQDITKLQEKEEEIRRILENARIEAEKGNKAKSDFLASMSHDIRTPMNAIIGYTNIARQHLDNPDMTDDYLKKIQVSSHYLLSLINDVLDMSKIESGKVQLNENECNLIEVFGRIADMTQTEVMLTEVRSPAEMLAELDRHAILALPPSLVSHAKVFATNPVAADFLEIFAGKLKALGFGQRPKLLGCFAGACFSLLLGCEVFEFHHFPSRQSFTLPLIVRKRERRFPVNQAS